MKHVSSIPTRTSVLRTKRWVGLAYTLLVVALLLLILVQNGQVVQLPAVLTLLSYVFVSALVVAWLLSRAPAQRSRLLVWVALLAEGVGALALIFTTGGATSPLWFTLLLVSVGALLLLPQREAALLMSATWFSAIALIASLAPLDATSLSIWTLRFAVIGLGSFWLRRALNEEEALRVQAEQREQVLHAFLDLSNRLRITSHPDTILEEIVRAVQVSSEARCVALTRIDWLQGRVHVLVAVGAAGRRLTAVEQLSFAWADFAPLLDDANRAGAVSYRVEALPFRHIRSETHLVLPLNSQYGEPHGLLTVSYDQAHDEAQNAALPLLELLANQAAAALDNSQLYATLEQRVIAATSEIEHSQAELAAARDRAETLYQVVRAAAQTLDEREVLSHTLRLVAEAAGAERGAVLLLEPNTGRLATRTMYTSDGRTSAESLERGQELAALVLASRKGAIIEDTQHDLRWRERNSETTIRAVVASPLMLDSEPQGVLLLTHRKPGFFREEHAQLLNAAADQIAVAVAKAMLYRFVSEQSNQLSMTLRLREEEFSKSQAILRSIGDGVVVADKLGLVRLINPAAEVMLGIDAEAYIGRMISDLPGLPNLAQAAPIDKMQVGERTLRTLPTPVRSPDNEPLGIVVIYHDVTREALTDKLKSEFIATASHELRTPLTSIRGYVDLLLLGTFGELAPAQADFLKIVKSNVGRLVDLIDDLLDVSKAEAGEVRLRRTETDVAEVVYEVAETLYAQFAERGISLAVEIQPELPAISADRQRLRQIILNLLGNACKYTSEGGNVDVQLWGEEDVLRLDIRDNGVGIAEEAHPFIFTPFFRADNPLRDAVGGTGLGLSITRTLVELHGGRIWFASEEGEGSVFSVQLPVHIGEWEPVNWLETEMGAGELAGDRSE